MKISVICENSVVTPMPRGLIGEHGLAFLIEDGDDITLFDTGQGVGIINNLQLLGKNVRKMNRIVISHGHYDHAGGLQSVLEARGEALPVFVHPQAFADKIAFIELPEQNLELPIGFLLSRNDYEARGAEFKDIGGYTRITDNIASISDIERPSGWKSWDTRLKYRENGKVYDDPFKDDTSLILETGSGPVVLLGCAHAGIVEILDNLSRKSGHGSFYAVIGGTHLDTAGEEYMQKTITALVQYRVKLIATSHCTGFRAAAALARRFGDKFHTASVGDSFEFKDGRV